MLDPSALQKICDEAQDPARLRDSIGLLSEKTLHAVCKSYFAPDMAQQEVKLGRFVADCFDGTSITEIQTGSFYPLQKKLRTFLESYPVRVVKPIIRRRTIYWADAGTGALSEGRKSSRTGRLSDIFDDLFWLGELFPCENLTVTVLLCDAADYRLLDGFGRDKKSHATRQDLVPAAFLGKTDLRTPQDTLSLLPPLPEPFTLKQLQKAARMTPRAATHTVKFLMGHGLLARCGKEKNAFLYKICVRH